jgi:hypothetical protein
MQHDLADPLRVLLRVGEPERISAIRCWVVFAARLTARTLACGRLRPAPRWSNSTIRYAAGSK